MTRTHSTGATLVAAFEGWNDAAEAATGALKNMLGLSPFSVAETIDSDRFFDLQLTRPILCTVSGKKRIAWPRTFFYEDAHQKLLTAIGPEPNLSWHAYADEFLSIARQHNVKRIIFLAAMFAECPHTRPLPVFVEDGGDLSVVDGTYSGPIGIPTVLSIMAAQAGISAETLWVSVPKYLGDESCPKASLALLTRLQEEMGAELDLSSMQTQSARWEADAAMLLLRYNAPLARYVHALEDHQDQEECSAEIDPRKTRQLIDEAEKYLRNFDSPGSEADGDDAAGPRCPFGA